MASNDAVFADSGVEIGDLLAGVSDDHCSGLAGVSRERRGSLLLSGVNDDVTTFCESIEDLVRFGGGAHGEAEIGVLGVGEAADGVEGQDRIVVGPAGGEIEHPAAADGRELVAVADEGDTGTVSRRRS